MPIINLSERGQKCILPSIIVKRMDRETNMIPKIAVGDLQKMVTFWGQQTRISIKLLSDHIDC